MSQKIIDKCVDPVECGNPGCVIESVKEKKTDRNDHEINI